jgi:hypothetical protein
MLSGCNSFFSDFRLILTTYDGILQVIYRCCFSRMLRQMSRIFRSCGSRVYSQYLANTHIFHDSNLHDPPRILITGLYNLPNRNIQLNKQSKELISSDQAVQASLLTCFWRGTFQGFKGFSFIVFRLLVLQPDVSNFTFLTIIFFNLHHLKIFISRLRQILII